MKNLACFTLVRTGKICYNKFMTPTINSPQNSNTGADLSKPASAGGLFSNQPPTGHSPIEKAMAKRAAADFNVIARGSREELTQAFNEPEGTKKSNEPPLPEEAAGAELDGMLDLWEKKEPLMTVATAPAPEANEPKVVTTESLLVEKEEPLATVHQTPAPTELGRESKVDVETAHQAATQAPKAADQAANSKIRSAAERLAQLKKINIPRLKTPSKNSLKFVSQTAPEQPEEKEEESQENDIAKNPETEALKEEARDVFKNFGGTQGKVNSSEKSANPDIPEI